MKTEVVEPLPFSEAVSHPAGLVPTPFRSRSRPPEHNISGFYSGSNSDTAELRNLESVVDKDGTGQQSEVSAVDRVPTAGDGTA